jgi:hypothetical protein
MGRDYQPQDFTGPNESRNEAIYGRGDKPIRPSHDEMLQGFGSTRHSSTTIADRPVEPRQVYKLRAGIVRLRSSEVATMIDVGKFRAIDLDDAGEFSYRGNKKQMRSDIDSLVRQRLIQIKAIPHEDKSPRRLMTLTLTGRRLLRKTKLVRDDQVLYYGFGKPHDAHHDAGLYRLYQRAMHSIERAGGRNLRVVLDYELKRRVNRDLAKLGPDYSPAAHEHIASRHELRLVLGKIPIPDVRIEYETAEGDRARVDLELVTKNYGLPQLLEKVRAGFPLYAYASDVSKLRRILDQRELTAEILSL